MPRPHIYNIKIFLSTSLLFVFALFISSYVFAADIQAVLDTADGSSGLVVQDSTNAARMRVLSNGNVGINTTTPQSTLEIIKSGTVTPVMVSSTAATPGDYLAVTAAGNIGIGTVGASSKLHINTGVDQNLRVRPGTDFLSSNGMALQSVNDAGSTMQQLTLRSSDLLLNLTGNIGVGTTTPQGQLVVLNGNVGVGTWAPQGMFEVRGGPVRVGSGTANNISTDGDLYVARNLEVDGSVWLGDATTDNLTVTGHFSQTGLTDFDTIEIHNSAFVGTAGGNLGVGTTAARASIEVLKNATNPLLKLSSTVAGDGDLVTINSAGNVGVGTTTPQGAMVVTSGNVGLGTWAPRMVLDVQGNGVRVGNGTFDNASGSGDLYVSGNMEVDGNVWLGDAAADNFTVTGTFIQSGDSSITGNFGIGTTTAQTKLAVLGPVGIGTWTTPQGQLAVMGGNVGVGTMYPSRALDVTGTVRSTTGVETLGGYTQSGSSVNTLTGATNVSGVATFSNATNAALFTGGNVGIGSTTPQGALTITTGNVGIGTWAPRLAFEVQGDGVRVGNGVFNNASGNGDLYVGGNFEVDGSVWLGDAALDNLTVNGTLTQNGDFNVSGNFGVGTTTPQTKLAILGPVGIGTWTTPQGGMAVMNGNVGVGVMNPSQALDVVGTVRSTTGFNTLGGYTQSGVSPNVFTGVTSYGDNVGVGTSTPQGAFTVTSGNVGIGTWAPSQALDVIGTVKSNAFTTTGGYTQSGASTNTITGATNVSGVATFSNATNSALFTGGNVGVGSVTPQGAFTVTNGNVGVGTWAPQSALQVVGTVNATSFVGNGAGITGVTAFPAGGANAIQYGNASTTLGDETKLSFNGTNVGINTTNGVAALDVHSGSLVVLAGNVGVGTSTPQSALAVTNGNVGIGTWDATQALDVLGTVKSNAFTTTGGYTQSGSSTNTITGTTNVSGVATFSNATASALFTGGNVGVGTTTPQGAFTVTSGNVGIGTWAPAQALDVLGTVKANAITTTGGYTQSGSSTNTITGATNVSGLATFSNATASALFTGGNVGVGSVTPGTKVDVQGTVRATAFVGDGALITGVMAFPAGGLNAVQYGDGLSTLGDETKLSFNGNNLGIGTTDARGRLVVVGGNVGVGTTTPQSALAVTNGNVGIGTWDATQALDVLGTVKANAITTTGGYTQSGSSTNTITGTTNVSGVATFSNATTSALFTGGNVGVGTTTPQGAFTVTSGNVGIGTWAPAQALDVNGTVRATTLTATSAITTTGGYTQSGSSANTFTGVSSYSNNVGIGTTTPQGRLAVLSGNVGIGTWSPQQALEVRGTVSATAFVGDGALITGVTAFPAGGQNAIQYGDGLTTLGDEAKFSFNGTNVGINTTNAVAALDVHSGNMVVLTGNIGVGTSTPQSALAVTNGNVGIGTWAAAQALDVNGTVKSNALSTAGGTFAVNGSGAITAVASITTTGGYTQSGASANTFSGLSSFNSNVGLGTDTPQGALAITNGNVGIGTWAPAQALDVLGTVKANAITTTGGYTQSGSSTNTITGATNVSGLATFSNATASALFTGGNVGVGSVTPGTKVDVQGTVRATSFIGDGALITGVMAFPAGGLNAVQYGDGLSTLGDETKLSFNGNNLGIGTTDAGGKLVVVGGNVGIGTTTPQSALAVTNGNVGIGTWDATQALDVLGTVKSNAFTTTGGYTQSGSSTNTITGTTNVSGVATFSNATTSALFTGGNVGVGTTTPQGAFTVTSGNVGIGTWAPAQALDVLGTVKANAITTTGGYTQSGSSTNTITGATNVSGLATFSNATASALFTGGNVGVGSVTPGTKVDVQGTVRATAFVGDGALITGVMAFPAGGLNAVQYGDGLSTLGDETKLSFNGNNLGIGTTDALGRLVVLGGNVGVGTATPQSALVVTNGNVGIGTWAATQALDVLGTVKANAITTTGGYTQSGSSTNTITGTTNVSGVATFSNATTSALFTGGNVGVGTTTPQGAFTVTSGNVGIGTWAPEQALDVNGAVKSSTLTIAGGTFAVNSSGAITATSAITTTGGYTQSGSAVNTLTGNVGLGTTTAQASFVVNNGNVGIGTWTADGGNLIVKGGGNVGVGTAWPGAAVDVVGAVRATSFFGNGAGISGVTAVPAGGLNAVQYTNGTLTLGDESKFSFDGNNVGIGTTEGTAKLDVVGTVKSTAFTTSGAYTQSGVSDNTFTGNVGLGTSTPQASLVVTNGNVGIGTWAPAQALDVFGTVKANAISTTGGYTQTGSSTNTLSGPTNVTGLPTFSNATASALFTGGNVGVGSVTPGTKVDVQGTVRATAFVGDGALITGVMAFPAGGLNAVQYGDGLSTLGDETKLSFNGNNLGIGTTDATQKLDVIGTVKATAVSTGAITATGAYTQSGTSVNTFTGNIGVGTTTAQGSLVVTNGNVGIGTWAPAQALDVMGTVSMTGLQLTTSPSAGYVLVTGSTGIGTWMPASTLPIVTSPAGSNKAVQYNNSGSFAGNENSFAFDGTNVGIGTSTPQGAFAVTSGNVGIGTWSSDGGNLIVNGGGNVGIGSAWPGKNFDVLGDARISGNVEINLQ